MHSRRTTVGDRGAHGSRRRLAGAPAWLHEAEPWLTFGNLGRVMQPDEALGRARATAPLGAFRAGRPGVALAAPPARDPDAP